MKVTALSLKLMLVMLVCGLAKTAYADGHVNPSFEEPSISKGSYKFIENVPGWNTTDSVFEVWGSGFLGVEAHDGNQFVELNAHIDGTLYQDSTGIPQDALLEFTFAHRGRNGDDTMKLTITDLGSDNTVGSGDDKVLFTKQYTTGKDAWVVYDSTQEGQIAALGNTIRFAYTAVHGTGGRGPDKTEGNLLDSADFGVGVVTAKKRAYGSKRLHTFGISGEGSDHHYLGMRGNRVGIPDETNPSSGNIFVLLVNKDGDQALLTDKAGKYLTARGTQVVMANTRETGSYWTIRDPLKKELHVDDGWFSLESAIDPGRYLRHYTYQAFAHKKGEMNQSEATHFLADASWRFVDADGQHVEDALTTSDRQYKTKEFYKEYTFQGSKGQTATVDLKSTEFDTYLVVYAPDGHDSDGDGKDDHYTNDDRTLPDENSYLEYELDQDGEYTVRVSSHSEGETGNYELRISSASGQTRVETGSLSSNDSKNKDGSYRQLYTFRSNRGEKIVLDLKSEDFDTHVQLHGPSGEAVRWNDDRRKRDKNSLLRIPLVDGEYRVRVTSHKPEETGRFELNITTDGAGRNATPQDLIGQWRGNPTETDTINPELNRSTDISKYAVRFINGANGLEYERQVWIENRAVTEVGTAGLGPDSHIKVISRDRILAFGVIYDRATE